MTREELYAAITAAGVALHPCNAADTAPTDDTAIYYLDTEELTNIYADITEEHTTEATEATEAEVIINGWCCVEVSKHDPGAFEYFGKWYFARYNKEDHIAFSVFCRELDNESY